MIKLDKLNKLSKIFKKLPGIGPKAAERLAYYIIQTDSGYVKEFINALRDVESSIFLCKYCFAPSEKEICDICSDDSRNHSIICVVEKVEDLLAVEKIKKYNGITQIDIILLKIQKKQKKQKIIMDIKEF